MPTLPKGFVLEGQPPAIPGGGSSAPAKMKTIYIEGRPVQVGDSFFELSHEDQNSTVDEIAQSLGINGSRGESQQNVNADNLARSFAHGIPIVGGAVDKFAAGMDALTQPILGRGSSAGTLAERYSLNAAAEQAHTNAFDSSHPIVATAAELAGGIGTFGAAAKIPGVAYSLGMGGGPVMANIARGAMSGAGIGSMDAAVRGGDAGAGAALGGVVGGLAPPIGRAVGAAYGGIANRMARQNYAGSATGALERAIGDDALTAGAMRRQAVELGPQGMLADLGLNLRGQAEAIAAQPGPGQRIVIDAMTARNAGASGRITDVLDSAIGGPINPTELADQIIARRAQQAAPLYDAAYQTPVKLTPELKGVLNTPAGKQALSRAADLSANEVGSAQGMFGNAAPQSLPSNASPRQYQEWLRVRLRAADNNGLPSRVDVRGLDLTKRALDDMASNAQTSGKTNEARIIGKLRDILLREVDRQAPQYAAARNIFSSESGIRDALENGRTVFSRSIAPDELRKTILAMTGGEREAFRQGTRAAVSDIMGSARNDAQAARALFQKGWTREKLAMVLGDAPAERLLQTLGRESNFAATEQAVLGNSRTAARLAAGREFPHNVGDVKIPHGLTAVDAALYFPRKIAGAVGGTALRARSAETSAAAANALTARGTELQNLFSRIEATQGVRKANALRAASAAVKTNAALRGGLLGNRTEVKARHHN